LGAHDATILPSKYEKPADAFLGHRENYFFAKWSRVAEPEGAEAELREAP
jgi:hypothetical protein